MKTYVALLRGINVGGRTLPMEELISILEGLGSRNVKTYIQSGNAVFQSEEDHSRLASLIPEEIKKRRGFEPCVLLLEVDELEKAISENPFPEAETDPTTLHVGFLSFVAENADLKALENLRKGNERFRLIRKRFYLHAPDGVGRSKLAANAEKLLGVPMTDRNWSTVCAIRDLAKRLGPTSGGSG